MAPNQDDLQRLRDAIAKGWDFTHCHEIDFAAAVTELLDDALECGASVAQKVYDCIPGTSDLRSAIDELEELVDAEPTGNDIQSIVDKLKEYLAVLEAADNKAQELLL